MSVEREMDWVLAGLRMLQEAVHEDDVPMEYRLIATDVDTHPLPTEEEIEALCERLNTFVELTGFDGERNETDGSTS